MRKVVFLLSLIVLALPVLSAAQEWSPEQTEVWKVIVAQWDADQAGDSTWTETALHASFQGWSNESPMPRDKESTKKWNKYGSENSTTHAQELSPVGIVVVDSTAVAHYFYSTAAEDRTGKHKTTHGRYTDVLIKQDGEWIFISWHGGDDTKADD